MTHMKTILIDAIDTFSATTGEIFQDIHQLVETYPNKKILVTGANDEQFKEWKLDIMPYEVFTLKHNPEKVDPVFYKTLLEHFGLTTNEVIYFEHNPKAVESAQSAGITSYHFDENTRDIVALKEFLDTNL